MVGFVLLCTAVGSWGGSSSVIARALKESAWFWYAHLFSLLLARLPGVHSWKWVCAWGHHSWEHLFEPSRPHTGREQERCCEEMALKVGLCTGIEQNPGSCCWAGEQHSLRSAWDLLRCGIAGCAASRIHTTHRLRCCTLLDDFQVTLAGYCFAFRYCPGGKHVAQREGSRTPHEGTIEFISLDSHKGAGESPFLTRASKAQLEQWCGSALWS